MKKCLSVLMLAMLTLSLLSFGVGDALAQSGFRLYEDWEDHPIGAVNSEKWNVSDRCFGESIANVSVQDYNGTHALQIAYMETTPDQSCWVSFADCPESIVGIKADILVESCGSTQDCRARIAWHRGTTPTDNYYLWEAVQVRPNADSNNQGYVSFSASSLDQHNNYDWLGDYFWTQFETYRETIDETVTVTAIFDKDKQITVTVEGEGTSTYTFEEKIENPIEIFKALGIRVFSGTGRPTNEPFIAHFDNIYIKRKGRCDNKKPQAKKIDPKNNLPLDACEVDITFSEPMDTCCDNIMASGDWPLGDTSWSNDQRTLTVERSNCGVNLPANTTIEFTINDGGTGFIDLKGNEGQFPVNIEVIYSELEHTLDKDRKWWKF